MAMLVPSEASASRFALFPRPRLSCVISDPVRVLHPEMLAIVFGGRGCCIAIELHACNQSNVEGSTATLDPRNT